MPRPAYQRRRPAQNQNDSHDGHDKSKSPLRSPKLMRNRRGRDLQLDLHSRRPNPHSTSNTRPNSARIEELARKLADKDVGHRPSDSDDSDNLVVKRRAGTAANGAARGGRVASSRTVEVYASGAVRKGDQPGAYPNKEERRNIMRDATEEILSQRSKSRSASRSSASASRSVSRNNSREGDEERAVHQKTSISKPTVNGSEGASQARSEIVPSVLGSVKPRRRKASILHMIANDGDDGDLSSPVGSDDEAQFLPDRLSTPQLKSTSKKSVDSKAGSVADAQDRATLRTTIADDQQNTTRADLSGPASRKRKRGSDVVVPSGNDNTSTDVSLSELSQTPELQAPSRSQLQKLKQKAVDEEKIMAMPESSPEPSPKKRKSTSPAQPRQRQKETAAPAVLSTKQLQSLMPKVHRDKPQRTLRVRDEFDIPDDTGSGSVSAAQEDQEGSDDDDGDENQSTFKPAARTRRTKKATGKPPNPTQKNAAGRGKLKDKSTNLTISKPATATKSTPSPSRPTRSHSRLPSLTPLSVSALRSRNLNLPPNLSVNREAKSPLQKRVDRNSTVKGKSTDEQKRQYGGSLRRSSRTTAGAGAAVEATGKENRVPVSSSGVSRRTGLDDDTIAEEADVVDVGEDNENVRNRKPASAGAKAWTNKWAEIDAWSMDFEDVSPSDSTGASVTATAAADRGMDAEPGTGAGPSRGESSAR